MALADKEPTWAAWMAAAQDGDSRAYHKLLADVQPVLTNFVRKRVPDSLTEDIVQEVLVAIHKVRHTYNPKQPFMPWLFAIARHKLIDALRKNGRKVSQEAVSLDDVETFIADTPNAFERADDNRVLVNAMEQHLNDKQKAIVGLMKVEGYSAQEVSDKMGMSVSAVKVTAHRAYKLLKEKLGG